MLIQCWPQAYRPQFQEITHQVREDLTKGDFTDMLKQNLVPMLATKLGPLTIQDALHVVKKELDILELRSRSTHLAPIVCNDANANFAINALITTSPPKWSSLIIDQCTSKDIVRASMHRCGCRVIQRLLLHVEQDSAAATKLHDSLLSNAKRKVHPFYGLCVMSVARDHGSSELQQVI